MNYVCGKTNDPVISMIQQPFNDFEIIGRNDFEFLDCQGHEHEPNIGPRPTGWPIYSPPPHHFLAISSNPIQASPPNLQVAVSSLATILHIM